MFKKLKYCLLLIFIPSILISQNSFIDTVIHYKKPYFISFNTGINFAFDKVSNSTFEYFNSDFSQSYGTGLGFSSQIGINYSLSEEFYTGMIVNFDLFSPNFSKENHYPIRSSDLSDTNNIRIDNVLNNQLSYLSVIPSFSYKLLGSNGNFNINFTLGIGLAFALQNKYQLKYKIVSPDYVHFLSNNSNEKIIAEGKYNDINSINIPFYTSLNSTLGINDNFEIKLESGFKRFLNNTLKNSNWVQNSAFLAIGFNYYFYETKIIHKDKENIELPIKIDTVPPKPTLSVKILKDSSEFYFKKGEELLATPPLVNSVFFLTNSSQIPEYYITKDKIVPELFNTDFITLKNYLFIRIKEILQDNPNSELIISGYTSGEKYETDNLNLARKRAENVKNVFVSLGIDSNRIKIKYDILPHKPSNMDFLEGIMENQRVDIHLKNAYYQKFVNLLDFVELTGNLKVKVDFTNILGQVILSTNVSDNHIIIDSPGVYNIPFSKRINDNIFQINVEARTSDLMAFDTIKVNPKNNLQIQPEINFDSFQAIMLFEYGSDELSIENKALLRQLVDYLEDGDKLIIQGSADALGQELRNKELTYYRAKKAMDYIKSQTNKNLEIEINDNYEKFNEITPEGRFLNRAISIKVIKNKN